MEDEIMYLPWITYRCDFKSIDGYTSDKGWGCMIRVAQMMIWTALMRHITSQFSSSCKEKYDLTYKELKKILLPLFLDNYGKTEAPFSIRNIIEIGDEILQKGAGEWYGAHSISQVIRLVNDKYNQQYYKSFRILTFNEGVVYKEEINAIFDHKITQTGLLVIIPLRLGLNNIDKVYYPQIKSALSNRLSIGILGGKKSYALYYVGYYDDYIISLDPHEVHDTVDEINNETYYSYITRDPKIISLTSCDTTMAFWFYLKDQEDAEFLYDTLEKWKQDYLDEYLIGVNDKRKLVEINDDEGEFDDDFELV